MKDELTVKTVNFMGDGLLAAQDSEGNIWTGVKWLCDGIGLSDGQIKAERKKIQEDIVLSKGGRNFILPTNGGDQETLCLQLDYVPLWLAKISITPNMKENNPELVDKLIEYQLKAKDVLAAAFLPQTKPVRRKSRKIGKKTIVALYPGRNFYILRVGDDFYDLEVDEFTELNSLIPMLLYKDVEQIPTIIRTYLSLHEKSSPKLEPEWSAECDE